MSGNLNEQSIYEIFRSCRLCGAGGGYKMPIIPSVVGLDCADDIELRQKIRECVQIEVNQDDKMPPLVCELCVDKVNDFYEFLEMCKQTNTRTRLRLGLPMQSLTQGSSDSGDCILGVTEQILCHEEPTSSSTSTSKDMKRMKKKEKKNQQRIKNLRKELETLIKQESDGKEARSDDDSTPPCRDGPIVIDDDDPPVVPRSKRPRDGADKEKDRGDDHKKIKLTIKLNTPKPEIKPGPKCSKRPPPSPPRSPSPEISPRTTRRSLEAKPGPKSSKPGPKSAKDAPKPGPKSAKLLPKRTREVTPTPDRSDSPEMPLRSLRRIASPEEKTPKSSPKKKETPGPKSSKQIEPKETIVDNSVKSKVLAGPKSAKVAGLKSAKVAEPKSAKVAGPKSAKVAEPKSAKVVGPKSAKQRAPSPVLIPCNICDQKFKTNQLKTAHLNSEHRVEFTPSEIACNACGDWFPPDGAKTIVDHHRWHSKRQLYRCRGCSAKFKQYQPYLQHTENNSCVPWKENPDVKCDVCWKEFPTAVVMSWHKCAGPSSRPASCKTCDKHYTTVKSLKRHEKTCSGRKKEVHIPEHIRSRLLPMQVRIVKCDALIKIGKKRVNVGRLPYNFGLDRNCEYPYRCLLQVKREPLSFDGMVSINQDIREALYKEEDYVHWDTDCSTDSEEEYSLLNPTEKLQKQRKVPSLTALSLKTLYSKQCLGKVPKRLRKVKTDKFESLFNTEFDNVQSDISNLIDKLIDDDNGKSDNDSVNLLGDVGDKVSDKIDFDALLNGRSEGSDEGKGNGLDVTETEPLNIENNVSNTNGYSNEIEKEVSNDISINSKSEVENVNGTSNSQLNNQTKELMEELNDFNCSQIEENKLNDTDVQKDNHTSVIVSNLLEDKQNLQLDSISDNEFNF